MVILKTMSKIHANSSWWETCWSWNRVILTIKWPYNQQVGRKIGPDYIQWMFQKMKSFYFGGNLSFQLKWNLNLHYPGEALLGVTFTHLFNKCFWKLFSRQFVRHWQCKGKQTEYGSNLPKITFYGTNTCKWLTWFASGNRLLDFSQWCVFNIDSFLLSF